MRKSPVRIRQKNARNSTYNKKYSNKNRKLRVLQVSKLYYPYIGGIERVVTQVAEGLAEQTEMSVLVCSEDCRYREETQNGVHVVRVPSLFRLGNLPVPFGLVHTLRRLGKEQDVIHLHMPFPFGDLACLLSGYRGKMILWWHSDVVRQKKLMHLYKPVMLRMLRRADKIVVATEGHIEGSAYLKPFREKCVVIPFGADPRLEARADAYIARREAAEAAARCRRAEEGCCALPESGGGLLCAARREAVTGAVSCAQANGEQRCTDEICCPEKNSGRQSEIEMKPLRFLFVGRLVYYKGCDVLLSAFAKLEKGKLVMAGSGDMAQDCRRLAEELGIRERVIFLSKPSDEELYRQYEACDVFVLPSVARSEAFGLVQIEAMAFGKPVINTNLPSGVPYVSLDKVTGLTVEPGDADGLADAMRWMAEHEKERKEMGERARERMKQEYRMDKMLERVKKLYEGGK